MKRQVGLVAAVAALGVGVYFASGLWAQQPAAQPAQPPAHTRVALVNVIQVIKSYHKFKTFNEEMTKLAKPFEENDKKFRDSIKQWQDAMKQPNFPAEKREEGEQAIKGFQRQIEDNALQAKKLLAKKNDEQMVQLYREVEDAVKRYALSSGFHVVMAYDEKAPSDVYNPQNIQRKLQGAAGTGGTFLMYAANGLDITEGVISTLNGAQAAAPAPGGAAAPR